MQTGIFCRNCPESIRVLVHLKVILKFSAYVHNILTKQSGFIAKMFFLKANMSGSLHVPENVSLRDCNTYNIYCLQQTLADLKKESHCMSLS